jgi:hypothetical protein
MFKIYNYEDYNIYDNITEDFLKHLNSLKIINLNNSYIDSQNEIINRIKIDTFILDIIGSDITFFYNIVERLIKNTNKIELTNDNVVLSTLCSLSIIFIEENKNNENNNLLVKNSKSILEELKMGGVGDGIVKSIINLFYNIKNLISLIYEKIKIVNFFEIFKYIKNLKVFFSSIIYLIEDYNLDIETSIKNFVGLYELIKDRKFNLNLF